MKVPKKENQLNAKAKLTLALCTVLAMSAGSVRAQDDNKNQGAPDSGTKSQIGTAGQAGQAGQQSGQLDRADEKFVRDAARGGKMEVHMGKMGVEKAQHSGVKQFAQKLVDDHGKANTELQQFAAKKGITLPQETPGLTSTDPSRPDSSAVGAPGTESGTTSSTSSTAPESKGAPGRDSGASSGSDSEMKKLHGLTGTDFDREYIRMAVKHHEKDVREFEQASQKVQDQELKAWIEKTLPTLREHLQTAQGLQTTVGGGAGAPGADSSNSSGTGTSSGTPETELKK